MLQNALYIWKKSPQSLSKIVHFTFEAFQPIIVIKWKQLLDQQLQWINFHLGSYGYFNILKWFERNRKFSTEEHDYVYTCTLNILSLIQEEQSKMLQEDVTGKRSHWKNENLFMKNRYSRFKVQYFTWYWSGVILKNLFLLMNDH